MTGLYIHIPFCLKKCPYCSFYSIPYSEEYLKLFIKYLKLEIQLRKDFLHEKVQFDTVFIGGGTPTSIGNGLFDVINLLYQNFSIKNHAEFSVEANPGTVDKNFLKELKKSGINRISIGIQSLIDNDLKILGRVHDKKQALQAVEKAVSAGFKNISIDLIFAYPGHKVNNWIDTIDEILTLGIKHLSAYEYTIEDNTPFQKEINSNLLKLPDEETIIQMTDILEEKTYSKGMKQYEISSFAKDKYYCAHNINYWNNGNYLGLGPSAVSYFRPLRQKNISNLEKYFNNLDNKKLPVFFQESLENEAVFRESFVMALRKKEALIFKRFIKEFQINPINYYKKEFKNLKSENLIDFNEEQILLTHKGWRLSNYVLSQLV